jgi:hypothetical protein
MCYQNQPTQSDSALEDFQGLNFSAETFSRSRARAYSLSRALLSFSLSSAFPDTFLKNAFNRGRLAVELRRTLRDVGRTSSFTG